MGTDSLYYIMDYSGNYYRLNQADELVAVCEPEATLFTFAQTNRRICVGKKSAFYCMIPIGKNADQGNESDRKNESDQKIDENQKNDTDQRNCADHENGADIGNEVKSDATGRNREALEENAESFTSPVKELTYDEVAEQVAKNASSYDLSEMDWAEYLVHFSYLVEGLKGYREELSKKHSDIDQKICDILHYIELCETDDDEAVDLVELLRVCRENRRDIKDELQRIEYFQTNLGTNANAVKAKQALKSIKGLETRKYKPRKYEELFENCIMKEKRLQKKDLYEESDVRGYSDEDKEQIQLFRMRRTDKDKGGEVRMDQEREYTPFDGKENDWLAFARQQAEFYRNAGQYIRNLQCAIRELDEEIEEILLQTEDANCNVTQGYKIFKRLKDLRVERKRKTQELNCLYALTDYIDCEALADTCEANLTEVEDVMGVSVQASVTNLQIADRGEQENDVEMEITDMVV